MEFISWAEGRNTVGSNGKCPLQKMNGKWRCLELLQNWWGCSPKCQMEESQFVSKNIENQPSYGFLKLLTFLDTHRSKNLTCAEKHPTNHLWIQPKFTCRHPSFGCHRNFINFGQKLLLQCHSFSTWKNPILYAPYIWWYLQHGLFQCSERVTLGQKFLSKMDEISVGCRGGMCPPGVKFSKLFAR